ncbi:MAG: type II secretion system protein GspF [Gammaproteobacteria bacterium]|nr:MAG: type II secretion system protein GspF [Gammaproteobacteria bacterium]
MPAFDYVALDHRGKKRKGVLEADSARQARTRLREQGLSPVEVEQAKEKQSRTGFSLGRRGLSATDLAILTRQLATLVQSGIPIEEALGALARQSDKARIRSMMMAVRAKVLEGYPLADSLGEYPSAFPEMYRATVAAGEHSGHLDLVLNKLADYTEQRQAARSKIQLAAIYPIILSVVAIAIVGFLLGYVVPDIIKVFVQQGQPLPPLTQVILALSNWVTDYGLIALTVLIIALVGFRVALRNPDFRFQVHHLLLVAPFIGRFVRGTNTARFTSTLAILNSSGVPLVDAMKIAGQVLSNLCLREALESATQSVREGGALHTALEQTGYFPPLMLHMIASGEASGELDQMLERTAHAQETEMQALIATLVGLFEPLMLLLMGGVVLIIVLAIMLPILNMSNLVG